MTHLSLCAGVGGIDLAAHWAGFETVAFCERDEFCQKVLAKHWPDVPIYDDVRTLDGTKFRGITLLSGGIPCQPHSVAGKREASGDERDLWGEFARIVGEARPKWVLVENVPGFLSSERGTFFGRVLDDLAGLGYRVGWGVWGAAEVGAVHRRKRVFIVAHTQGWEGDERRRRELDEAQRGGQGSDSATEPCGPDASHAGRVRCERVCQSGPERQDDQERQVGRAVESARAVCNTRHSSGLSDAQASSTSCAIGEERRARADACRSDRGDLEWLGTGDWRAWDVEPVVRQPHDGLPRQLANAGLKALGNAVCPQQVYPLLAEMARQST